MEFLLGPLIEGLLKVGRRVDAEPAGDGSGWVLRYGTLYRLAVIFVVAAFGGLLGLAFVTMTSRAEPALFILFGIYFILGLYLLINAFRRKVLLDKQGMWMRRPFLGLVQIEWNEIERVSHVRDDLLGLKIKLRRGRSRRLSTYLNGLGRFRACLEEYAPEALDASALAVLPRLDLL
jgi:hypothetical protein